MNSSIQLFNNNEFSVRSIEDNGEIWFVAKDIAECLEYSEASVNNPGVLFANVPAIWADHKPIMVRSENGIIQEREMLCLTEQGVYFFLGRSDKPKALPYQMWIAGDVVPSIRKTGNYSIAPQHMSQDEIQAKLRELEIRSNEVNLHRTEFIRSMLDNPPFPITPETRTVFAHEAFRLSSGHECLAMLPECTDKWYTASELGSILGISANKVGRIAIKNGIKPPEGESNRYGRWIFSKSKHSSREVPSFIYSSEGLEWFREYLEDIA
ncbi:MAG: hypothetical protein IJM68_00910 [Synergistaceae bacterium]|nr:hypothetical protein [Synergistaceae bacterium]